MSDCVALLVTLECNYQPRVLFPALIALRWLRTSPIFVGFAVLPLLSLLFTRLGVEDLLDGFAGLAVHVRDGRAPFGLGLVVGEPVADHFRRSAHGDRV